MRSKICRSDSGSVARKNSPPVRSAIRLSRPSSIWTSVITVFWLTAPVNGSCDLDRHRDASAAPDQDRVDAHLHRLGHVGRRAGIDLTRVVRAVGDEHHHPALRLRAAQARERGGEARADRGAVRQHLEPHVVELAQQHGRVGGRRRLRQAAAREDDEPDAVALPATDELGDRLLGHRRGGSAAGSPRPPSSPRRRAPRRCRRPGWSRPRAACRAAAERAPRLPRRRARAARTSGA